LAQTEFLAENEEDGLFSSVGRHMSKKHDGEFANEGDWVPVQSEREERWIRGNGRKE